MADRKPQRRNDQGKFADLGHRETGLETGTAAVPHAPHDHQNDYRVADEYEQGKDRGRPQLAPDSSPVQPGT